MRLLIVKPSSLGDVVHAFAFVNALKAARPEVLIDWLANDMYASFVKCNSNVEKVWSFKRGGWGKNWASPSTVADVVNLVSWIRREKYDVCLDLQGLLRSGLFTWFSGAVEKAGFSNAREGAGFFYDKLIDPGEKPHAAHKLLCALEMFGVAEPVRPDFGFTPSVRAVEFVGKLLGEVGIRGKFLVFHSGARWSTKMWPAEHWRALAESATKKFRLPVIFTGSSADSAQVGQIVSGVPGAYNFAGSLGLVELSALLQMCFVTVTVDSGPMHISAAFNKPIVALFGPTSPEKTGPLTTGPKEILRPEGMKCAPCFSRKCSFPVGCMEKITPQMVESRLERMLSFLGH
ncbi:MAG: glycosyltransferase family 9 protein [Nitrospinae bacterium]|nr:glycosyltransferase family 9 protein [Nitrospinota bacterium]